MSKYKAIKTTIDGIVFASRKEANRYAELKLLEQAGMISGLEWQVPFELVPKQGSNRAVKYIADFVYTQNGEKVVEDVKGYKTAVYRLKKRLMIDRYGIEIQEV